MAADLGVADVSVDEVYAGMDWLAGCQEAIETKLVRTHLAGAASPARFVLFDLSSFWVTGGAARRRPAGSTVTARRPCPRSSTGC